ncbi:MAG: hypothetical protein LBP32_06685 [Spirochaetaceae bacterium]|jgi:hypothetical protein|nr:hypothetical protein [Spirochaetaceae bacterium]
MGLLSKAVSRENPKPGKTGRGLLRRAAAGGTGELDEMGKVLRNRILRLSRTKTSPTTALSLLKAYGSFRAGFCLGLKNDAYVNYASIGLGIEKISIPQDGLNLRAGLSRLNFPEQFSIKPAGPDTGFWSFPLDDAKPSRAILLLEEDPRAPIDPRPLERLLHDCREILIPPGESKPPEPAGADLGAREGDAEETARDPLEAALVSYHRNKGAFRGLILEPPASPPGEEDPNGFTREVSGRIASFGAAVALSSGRCLILFPHSLDQELMAHRLSKDLKAVPVFNFEAADPQDALRLVQPYR